MKRNNLKINDVFKFRCDMLGFGVLGKCIKITKDEAEFFYTIPCKGISTFKIADLKEKNRLK